MKKQNPSVYVLILNWNGLRDTLSCIASVQKSDYGNFRIVVVDNASADGSVAAIRKRFPKVEIVPNKSNLGFAGGNDVGLRLALRRNADYVFVLNNDTVVAPDAISLLVSFMESHPEAGAVGPKIYYHSLPKTIWSAGSHLFLGKSVLRGIGKTDEGQFEEDWNAPQVVGAAMLMRAEALRKVGLFDEGYFAYYEETKWCLLARNAGWEIWYHPKARIWHKVAASTGGGSSPLSIYYLVRNRFHLISEALPWQEKVPAMLSWLAEVAARASLYSAKGKFPQARAALLGASHALAGRKGPYKI